MGPIDVKMHLASFLSPRPPYTLLSLTSSYPTYPSYPLTCSPLSVYPPYHTHLHQLNPFFLPAKHHSIPLAPFHHAFLTLYFLHKFSSSPGKLPKDANISTLILSLLSLFPVPCSSLSPLSLSLSKFTVGFSFSILEILSTFFDTNVVWVVQNLEIITAYRKCGGGKSSATGWEFHGKLGCLDSSLNPLLLQ